MDDRVFVLSLVVLGLVILGLRCGFFGLVYAGLWFRRVNKPWSVRWLLEQAKEHDLRVGFVRLR